MPITAKPAGVVAFILLLTACASAPHPKSKLDDLFAMQQKLLDVNPSPPEGETASWPPQSKKEVLDTYYETLEKCTRATLKLYDEEAEINNKTKKTKLITGALTGGTGTIGGFIAGGLAFEKNNDKAVKAVSITTAGLTLVGTFLAIFLAPGEDSVAIVQKKMDEIGEKTASLKNKIENTQLTEADLVSLKGDLVELKTKCELYSKETH